MKSTETRKPPAVLHADWLRIRKTTKTSVGFIILVHNAIRICSCMLIRITGNYIEVLRDYKKIEKQINSVLRIEIKFTFYLENNYNREDCNNWIPQKNTLYFDLIIYQYSFIYGKLKSSISISKGFQIGFIIKLKIYRKYSLRTIIFENTPTKT